MGEFQPINTQEELDRVLASRLQRERDTVTKSFQAQITERDEKITGFESTIKDLNKQIESLNGQTGRVAELEAKVFTYEKFVANSTFAPLLNGYISRQAHEKELEEKQDIIDRMAAEKEILEVQYDDLEKELKELKKGERSDE